MKQIIVLLFLIVSTSFAIRAQIILPKFEPAVKIERLSDEAEESNIFTYNKGNNLFYYRTYIKGEGKEMQVIRQNIWFSHRENDEWEKPDRLFRMRENEVENIIIGSSEDGNKVYIFKTIFHPTEDTLERVIGSIAKNEEGDWGDFQELQIPGLILGENYFHFHLSHDEKILMVSMSPTDQLLDEDLFVSFKQDDGGWSELTNLGPTINTRRVEISPYIDNDGKTLYFSSEGHGGFGGSDVFVSYRLDDTWTHWTEPKNLGESINSKDYEENFVHTRNNEYYFTSNKDSESADIYYTYSDYAVELNKGNALLMKQNTPMAASIEVMDNTKVVFDKVEVKNDGKFQFNIKESMDSITFSASEKNVEGAFIYTLDEEGHKRDRMLMGDDLKSLPESELKKEQKIVGSLQLNGEALIDTEIEVYDINDYKLGKCSTDENGIFRFEIATIDHTVKFIPKSDQDWKFNSIQLFGADNQFINHLAPNGGIVSKENTNSEDQLAKNTKPVAPPIKTATETSLKQSTEYTNVVYFEFNAISLSAIEERKLQSVVKYLKNKPSLNIVISGNTDSVGEKELNISIGEERAFYVKQVLKREGIKAERITTESKGMSNPIAPNDNEEGRSKNRRVELLIK